VADYPVLAAGVTGAEQRVRGLQAVRRDGILSGLQPSRRLGCRTVRMGLRCQGSEDVAVNSRA
jgi:hypothetical protein